MRQTQVLSLAGLMVLMCGAAIAEPRWQLQYFHDELRSTLSINDIKFPTPRRGLAVGTLQEERSTKAVMVSTNDGGQTWSMQKLKEHPVSLFFLNDSLGWMATDRGIWRTEEAGQSWSKIKSLTGILRVHFLDENRGFAIGLRKTLLGTTDGGKSWSPLQIVESIPTSAANTVFSALDFLGGRFGLVAGWSRPPRRVAQPFPDWMDPEAASRRRELPATTIVIETRDGGVNWKPQVTSTFGRVSQVVLNASGAALSLIEFDQAFEWPSEVFFFDMRTGKSERVFRKRDRAVTSMIVDQRHTGYLAAIECAGTLRRSPIPGKLHILRATDLKRWDEMRVDYRAVARQAMLAAAGTQVWVATDTGMILKLQSE